MKKLLWIPFLLLLVAPQANAAKPIPALKDTAAYKNLRSYVAELEAISTATPEEKAAYTSELSARVQAGEAQVVLLFDRRKKRLIQNYDDLLQKRYNQIAKRARSRSLDARQESERSEKKALREFRKKKEAIAGAYADRLRPLEQRVRQLQRQADSSNDPREQALLQEEINLIERKIVRIRLIIRSETGQARSAYEKSIRRIERSLRNKLRSISEQKDVERREAKRAWADEKSAALDALRNKRRIDSALVRELRVRGQEAIAAMTG